MLNNAKTNLDDYRLEFGLEVRLNGEMIGVGAKVGLDFVLG